VTRRVVLIEDDPDIAALIEDVLVELGHEVIVRDRLVDDTVDQTAELVITDLVAVTSFDLAAARSWIGRVRVTFPRAKIMVATAHAPAERAGASTLGADAVLTKPFDVAAFTDRVESLLGA
jgi:DNA-binding response OmpR family regulator